MRRHEDLPALVLTCGPDGILAVTKEGAWLAASPVQQEVNAAGAGDAVSGALPYRLSLGDPWPEALRWAAAISAAAVLTPGTADCRLEDVERILEETTVRQLA
jgi:fructose-1-phosphate kinase PfkB-like protein